MFSIVNKVWNPLVGCRHSCVYCWSRRVAKRLKRLCEKCYRFEPHIHYERLRPLRFRNPRIVFVVDMGDLFGSFIPDEWIMQVIDVIRKSKNVIPLFLTKNPKRYEGFLDVFPKNSILGATIETNRYYSYISNAPEPRERIRAMANLDWDKKFISIEPILDFDFHSFLEALKEIRPIWVEVGYDNYGFVPLPEPSLVKTQALISELSKFTKVNTKTLRNPRFSLLDIYASHSI